MKELSSFEEILKQEGGLSYQECNALWEKEQTKVHEDVSDTLMEEIAEYISSALSLKAGDRVLTIGCGDGVLDRFIAPKVEKLYGLDFSKQKLEVAKMRNPAVEYHEYSFLDEKYSEGLEGKGINKIYSYSVMQYCKPKDIEKYIDNQIRVLDHSKNCRIVHLDIPDVNKAYYYYEKLCDDVTEEVINNSKDRIKFLIGDGSCWHDVKEMKKFLSKTGGGKINRGNGCALLEISFRYHNPLIIDKSSAMEGVE